MVSEALIEAGITATLSGGSAVTLYTENRYQSADLDFVTTALVAELVPALETLGFEHTGSPRLSVFEHPKARWYLEFPPAPLSFGGTYVDAADCPLLPTPFGRVRIITATQAVMDRLIAAASWQDAQALEQAVMVATHQSAAIDWGELDAWLARERINDSTEVAAFLRSTRRR